jgi:hypothetical protein
VHFAAGSEAQSCEFVNFIKKHPVLSQHFPGGWGKPWKLSVRTVVFWPRIKSGSPELKLETLTLEPTCFVSMLLLLFVMAGRKMNVVHLQQVLFFIEPYFCCGLSFTYLLPLRKLWAYIIISKQVYDRHLHEQKCFLSIFIYKKTCWCSVMYKECQLLDLDLWKPLMTVYSK